MGVWNDRICALRLQYFLTLEASDKDCKELITRQRPFMGRNEVLVMHAVTHGEIPSFPSRSNNTPDMIRDMLEKICRRCWTSSPGLRPTMRDIVDDLRPETWFLREYRISSHPIHNSGVSNLKKAL